MCNNTQYNVLVIKMKKCGYIGEHLPSYGERQEEIDEAKYEDRDLPVFSKEVPFSSERTESDEGILVRYSWKESKSPNIKIKKMLFRKSEKLGDLYRIDRRDCIDRLVLVKSGRTYILRKTAKDVSRALYKVAEKITLSTEKIIGYLESLLGSFYVISVVEKKAWTFDGNIVSGNINYLDPEKLDENHKKKISELIIEKLSSLHFNNLVLGGFTLHNILVYNDGLKFTDLRWVRVSRKKSFVVEEFRGIMKYLLSAGFVKRDDVVPAVAYYSAENNESCSEWYSENFGRKPKDEIVLASKIEEKILS